MIQIILTVCLAASPAICQDVDPLVELTPVACQIMGQVAAMPWLYDHPKWTLRGWRCREATNERRG